MSIGQIRVEASIRTISCCKIKLIRFPTLPPAALLKSAVCFLTFLQVRGKYYQNNWYFCPLPFFPKMILYSTVKISSFPPFSNLLSLILAFFFKKKSSYISPNQPKTHVFAPPPPGEMKNKHPCFKSKRIYNHREATPPGNYSRNWKGQGCMKFPTTWYSSPTLIFFC